MAHPKKVSIRIINKPLPSAIKKLLLFGSVWLAVGFTAGTETLMGPVRWAAALSRKLGWSSNIETGLVNFIIVLFVISSFVISLWLTKVILTSRIKHIRLGIPIVILLATLGSLYFWLNPQVFGTAVQSSLQVTSDGRFTFGAYPSLEKMQRLKREGYSAVVSLLHPAVVPFEPKLLADEKKAARAAGLEVIHVPMLPWISNNKVSINKIQDLASQGEGKYYVHCYLGKDRINVAKRIIEMTAGPSRTIAAKAATSSGRKITSRESFERGPIFRLQPDLFVTPYPTDEEFFAFILNGSINQVVSLMNPEKPTDKKWIDKERDILMQYQLPFSLFPISSSSYDPYEILAIVEKVKELPHPVVIHGVNSPSYRTQAFIQAFFSGLPPLPPLLFSEDLEQGKVEILAPNIAVGPRPTGREFKQVLYRKGIRSVIYLGNPNSREADADARAARRESLMWQAFIPNSSSDQLVTLLEEDGPWYLYGPLVPGFKKKIIERFGPAVPDPENPFPAEEVAATIETAAAVEPEKKASLIGPILPDLKLIILASPLFLLYTVLGAALAGWLRMQRKVRTAYTRKIFHFYVFTIAGILHLSIGFPGVALFGSIVSACVLYSVWRGKGFPFYEAMARPSDEPHRSFFIIVPLITTALGGLTTNLLFSKFAYIGYFVGGWGDAVGEPVGARWGKHRYQVPSLMGVPATRSWEGSAAVLTAGTLVALLGLFAAGLPFSQAVLVALACGTAGALVEAFSAHGLDNFTIQVAAAATAALLIG